MAQAGIHGLVGTAVRKFFPTLTWFLLGIVLGILLPDVDNIFVAIATVTKKSTEGLHRRFPTACSPLRRLLRSYGSWNRLRNNRVGLISDWD